MADGSFTKTFGEGVSGKSDVAFSPNGEDVFIGDSAEGMLRKYTSNDWSKVASANVCTGERVGVNCVVCSPDGQTIFTGDANGYVKAFSTADLEYKDTLFHGTDAISHIALSKDGSMM